MCADYRRERPASRAASSGGLRARRAVDMRKSSMGDADLPVVAGIELGGTKAIAVLARGDRILSEARMPTETPELTLPALADVLSTWSERFAGIGVASFGPVALDAAAPDRGRILKTPKPGWEGADVLGPLRAFGVPLALDTDVAGAALAEGRWGAAAGHAAHAYVTIGTGVGVGLIANGRPVHGFLHPEIGHLRVRRVAGDDFPGVCPFHGDCIEGLVSGPAIAARAAGIEAHDVPPDDAVWSRVAADLAELVCALLLACAPSKIVIGGGLGVGQAGHLLPRTRIGVVERLAGYLPLGRVGGIESILVPAALGDQAGPLGATALALAALGR